MSNAPGAMAGSSSQRELSIDFARGTAMLFVFLAHFSQELWVEQPTGIPLLLLHFGMVASPTFVLISGLTLAFVLGRTRPGALPLARVRVFDRALFLLLVAHAVLVISDVLLAPYQRAIRQIFITDLVALNLLVGLVLLPRTGRAARLAIAVILYDLGWVIHFQWHPTTLGLAVAEEILSGPTATHALEYGFPFLQWAGLFLVGTVLGDALAAARTPEARHAWATRLLRGGVAAVLLAACLKALVMTSSLHTSVAGRPELREFLSIFGKDPPSPIYLMFFGGAGACLIAGATFLSLHDWTPRLRAWVSVFGRNSLFVFLLQSAVFRDIIARVPLEGRPWSWPFAFLAATLFIWSGAWVWDRMGGNRWLTLGIGRLKAPAALEARQNY